MSDLLGSLPPSELCYLDFEAKLTFKHQSLPFRSIDAVDTIRPFFKKRNTCCLERIVLKLLMTFIVVERQSPPSWPHLNMGLLPGVIVPVFI